MQTARVAAAHIDYVLLQQPLAHIRHAPKKREVRWLAVEARKGGVEVDDVAVGIAAGRG